MIEEVSISPSIIVVHQHWINFALIYRGFPYEYQLLSLPGVGIPFVSTTNCQLGHTGLQVRSLHALQSLQDPAGVSRCRMPGYEQGGDINEQQVAKFP